MQVEHWTSALEHWMTCWNMMRCLESGTPLGACHWRGSTMPFQSLITTPSRTTVIDDSNCITECFNNFVILWSSGKGQARMGKGWLSRRKVSKLKPLPRAYIKVGCHHHHQKFNFTQLMARYSSGEASGGKGRCVGSLWVTLGSL